MEILQILVKFMNLLKPIGPKKHTIYAKIIHVIINGLVVFGSVVWRQKNLLSLRQVQLYTIFHY